MSITIEEYYKKTKLPEPLIIKKLEALGRNSDIKAEFEYWLEHRKYKEAECVKVNEYTAKSIAALSEYVDGEGAFMLLIELRENSGKGIKRIENGFKMK